MSLLTEKLVCQCFLGQISSLSLKAGPVPAGVSGRHPAAGLGRGLLLETGQDLAGEKGVRLAVKDEAADLTEGLPGQGLELVVAVETAVAAAASTDNLASILCLFVTITYAIAHHIVVNSVEEYGIDNGLC